MIATNAEVVPVFELWFRLAYRPLLEERAVNLVVRPDDRQSPHPKAPPIGEIVRVRVITQPGDETLGTLPVFDSYETTCTVRSVVVKPIAHLTQFDLKGASPDARYPFLVPFHLGLIYNRVFVGADLITLITFTYPGQLESDLVTVDRSGGGMVR